MRLKIIPASIAFLSCLFLTSCESADTYTGPVLGDVCNGYEDFQYLEETELEIGCETVTLFVPKGRIIRLEKDNVAALCEGIDMRIGTMPRREADEGERQSKISRTYCQKLLAGTPVYIEINVLEEECSEYTEDTIRELEDFYQLSILCDRKAIHKNPKKDPALRGFPPAAGPFCDIKKDEILPKSCLIFVLKPDQTGVRDLSDCYLYWRNCCQETFFHLYSAASAQGQRRYISKFLLFILEKALAYPIKGPDMPKNDTLLIIIQAGHDASPRIFHYREPSERPLIPTGSSRYTAYSTCPSAPTVFRDRLSL